MDRASEDAHTGRSFSPREFQSATAILAARQAMDLGRSVSLSILAGAVVLATLLFTFERWRAHRHGVWAKPAGEPSLDSPLTASDSESNSTAWLRLAGLVVAVSLGTVAYLTGMALDTLPIWIIGYGIVHMTVYSLSLWLNLGMREHVLPVVWFVSGGMYGIIAGKSLVLVLGIGWLLTGLLLWCHQRAIEKRAHFAATADRSEAPQ